ncbi:MAG: hypothetical protein R3C03_11700 [Pirellulaceae bacterium]
MKKFERKTNYIDSSVQGSLVKRIMIHWLAFFGITAASFVTLHAFLGNPDLPLTERIAQTISEFSLIGLLMLATLPAFALDTIRFSNRFVGPMMRLRRAMRELNTGENFQPLKFRGDDFWQDVANEFNTLAERLNGQSQPKSEESAETADV